jgi:hypothetical protein
MKVLNLSLIMECVKDQRKGVFEAAKGETFATNDVEGEAALLESPARGSALDDADDDD